MDWFNLNEKFRSHVISNVKDLEKALVNITPNYCKKLVRSIANRLEGVTASKGLTTKY